jgi:hypothetical protein
MNTFNESKIVMVYAIISIFITAIINRRPTFQFVLSSIEMISNKNLE